MNATEAVAPPDGEGTTWTSSHREILQSLGAGRRAAGPDAIVVPTSRPAGHPRPGLDLAIELAVRCRCQLVVLCSGEAATTRALTELGLRLDAQGAEVDAQIHVLSSRGTAWTSFAADRHPVSGAYRPTQGPALNDVGRKRNLGLLLARAHGWRTVLFLDDDIRAWERAPTLDAESAGRAAAAVLDGRHAAVGWTLRDYDDNSVLFRIRDRLRLPQDQFIGGGALLVGVDVNTPYFPSIYNEDWLFLLALLRQNPAGLADAGSVHQSPYEGLDAGRARREEYGDLICEALMSTVVRGQYRQQCLDPSFWAGVIEARRILRDELEELAEARRDQEVLPALRAVAEIHADLADHTLQRSGEIVAYLASWSRDLVSWRRRLAVAAHTRPDVLLGSGEVEVRQRLRAPAAVAPQPLVAV